MQPQLNLPPYSAVTRIFDGQQQIFDPIRKKYVALTPEEWVRQHFVNYLVAELGYPAGLLAVELPVIINGMQQRADIVAHNRSGAPFLVVECKAASVGVGNDTFLQAARYNLALRAEYLAITNGLKHYCSKLNLEAKQFQLLNHVPHFGTIG